VRTEDRDWLPKLLEEVSKVGEQSTSRRCLARQMCAVAKTHQIGRLSLCILLFANLFFNKIDFKRKKKLQQENIPLL
jgi:hypothetical protein